MRQMLPSEYNPTPDDILREHLDDALGFKLDTSILLPHEQDRLSAFMKDIEPVDLSTIRPFLKIYGLTGLRAFLALDSNMQNYAWGFIGSTIAVGDSIPEVVGGYKLAFKKIVELDIETQNILKLHNSTNDTTVLQAIVHNLNIKTAQMLFSVLSPHLIDIDNFPQVVAERLKNIYSSAFIFTSVFKTLYTSGKLDIKELKDTELEVVRGGEIPEEQVNDMVHIMEQAYTAHSELYTSEFITNVITAMKEHASSNADSKFYIYKRHGKIIGYLRFDREYDQSGNLKSKYVGSVTINNTFNGGDIGQAILAEAIRQEEQDNVPMHLHCDARDNTPTTKMYQSHGFEIESTDEFAPGVPANHMVRHATTQTNDGE